MAPFHTELGNYPMDWKNKFAVRKVSQIEPLPLQVDHTWMKKQKNGSIINISSYAVFEPEKYFPTSGVMRASLSSFTKIYSDEYAKYNIRINNILPGFIDSLKPKKEFIKRVPLKRAGKVSEISAVIRLLASSDGSYITGQNFRVDGGITRSI